MEHVQCVHYSNPDMNVIENHRRAGSLWAGSLTFGIAALVGMSSVLVETPWVRMWLLAVGMYFGVKALVLMKAPVFTMETAAWLLLCPALSLTDFLRKDSAVRREARSLLVAGLVNITFGAVLLWGVMSHFAKTPLVAGWIGMTGIIFLLHFGALHIVTSFWMNAGRYVVPLMKCPIAADSLSDFWGRRWNTAFRDLMNNLVFRPAAKRWSARAAHWLVFLTSGLLHEVVVSLPAGGGWGGPTGYFLLQAFGIELGRCLRIPRGIASRLWAFAFLITPLGLLFHTPFIHRVMLPFFQTLKALP
jgi:hypothetical protein